MWNDGSATIRPADARQSIVGQDYRLSNHRKIEREKEISKKEKDLQSTGSRSFHLDGVRTTR